MFKLYNCISYRKRPFILSVAFFFICVNLIAQGFSSSSSSTFPAPQFSARSVQGDFDKDGDADILYQTNGDGSAIQYARSNGDGTFTILAQSVSPFAGLTLPNISSYATYRVADFDGDGDNDVWIPAANATGTYFRNDGNSFSTQSSATFPAAPANARNVHGDFDADGDVDILYQTGTTAGSPFSYARSNGDGTFTIVAQASSPFAGLTLPDVATYGAYRVADFDGDGDNDVWIPASNNTGTYFRNDGNSFSAQSSATFPAAPASARNVDGDFDADGDVDILYQTGTAAGSSFSYARSNGNGTFTISQQASSPFAGLTLPDLAGSYGAYRVADFDGDKDIDVWIPAANATGTYFMQNGAPPYIVSTSPANNATGVSPNANIVFNFSEIVNKNTGTIYIRRVSDNSLAEAINVTSASVTGGGTSTITINPSVTLASNTQYYITADAETFVDAGGAAFAGITNTTTLRFTTVAPPSVTSVSVPANGTYKIGDNLNFTVNFGSAVVVNTAGGTPYIPLTIGASTKNATYISGSGTGALVFRYTIASGDADNNGIAVGSSITLNAGTIKDASGTVDANLTLNNVGSTTSILVDGVAPSVNSINRQNPSASSTNATSVTFRVTFSESVSNIGTNDFTLTSTGTATGTIALVSGSTGAIIDVVVNSVSGDGTLRLDLNSSGTGITDGPGNPISGGYTSGQTYDLDHTAPSVNSINRQTPASASTNATSLVYRVTFNESVSNVDVNDFVLTVTGTAAGTIAAVSASSGSTMDVTVNSVNGNGTIRLDLKSSGTGITDAVGNAASSGYTSGETYTVNIFTWTGTTDNNWSTASNWDGGVVPGSTTDVIIPTTASNMPVSVTGTQSAQNITIQASSSLSVTGTLQISGAVINNGTFTATAGTIELNGSSAQTIAASTFSSNTVQNLTVNNSQGGSLGGTLNITGTVMVTNGSLTTNGNLVLKSTADGTARVGALAPGTSIVGTVTVERFITDKSTRKNIFLASPVSEPIADSWQQQIHITGPGSGGTTCTIGDPNNPSQPGKNSNGFDVTHTNNPSFFTYNTDNTPGNRWETISNTGINLAPGTGYRVMIRGARSQGCALLLDLNVDPQPVTLSAKGTLTQGNKDQAIQGAGFTLLGNPYASEIDFEDAVWGSLRTANDIDNAYWIYDPANTTGNGSVSTYSVYSMGSITNSSLSNPNIIASGQAFFVHKSTNGDVLPVPDFWQEGYKVTSTQPGLFRAAIPKWPGFIRAGLKKADGSHLDEIIVRFLDDAGISKNFNSQWDARSFNDGAPMIAGIKDNIRVAIQTRPATFTEDIVQLRVASPTSGSFKLSFTQFENFLAANIYLSDKFTGVLHDVKANPVYAFNITADAASQGDNRFELIFRAASVLPVDFINITAVRKTGGIDVNWKVPVENNVAGYQVERSENGRSFTKVADVASRGNSIVAVNYSWLDRQPLKATGYYRIKASNLSGEYKYSPVVKVGGGSKGSQLSFYPNPVKDVLNVLLGSDVKGSYSFRVVDGKGVRVMSQSNLNAANNVLKINTASLSTGVYMLEIISADGVKETAQFVK